MNKRDICADDILYRFTINESGSIVYARDMIGGHGCIRKKQGELVSIIRNGAGGKWKRIDFSECGITYHTTPGIIGFVLAFGKMPKQTEAVVHIDSSSADPNNYSKSNLVYTTHSDSMERGSMRVMKNGKQWMVRALRRSGWRKKYLPTKEQAIRFAVRYHRIVVKATMRDFWDHVGVDVDLAALDLGMEIL